MQSRPSRALSRICARCQTVVPVPSTALSSTSAVGWTRKLSTLYLLLSSHGQRVDKPASKSVLGFSEHHVHPVVGGEFTLCPSTTAAHVEARARNHDSLAHW